MAKALDLGDHFDAEAAAVGHQLPGLLLRDELAVGHAIVGEGRPDACPAFLDGVDIGFVDLRVALELHAGRNLQDDEVVAHGGENIFDDPLEKRDIFPGGDHQVSATPGHGGMVGDLADGKQVVLQEFCDGFRTVDEATEVGSPEGNGGFRDGKGAAVGGDGGVMGEGEGGICGIGNGDAGLFCQKSGSGLSFGAVPTGLLQQSGRHKSTGIGGAGGSGIQGGEGGVTAENLDLFQRHPGQFTGEAQGQFLSNHAGIQKHGGFGKGAVGLSFDALKKLLAGIEGNSGEGGLGAEVKLHTVDEERLVQTEAQAKIGVDHVVEIHLKRLAFQRIAGFG